MYISLMILCIESILQLSTNLLNIRLPILWRKLNTKLWKSSESSVFRYLSAENWVSTEEFRKNNESTRLGFAVHLQPAKYCLWRSIALQTFVYLLGAYFIKLKSTNCKNNFDENFTKNVKLLCLFEYKTTWI